MRISSAAPRKVRCRTPANGSRRGWKRRTLFLVVEAFPAASPDVPAAAELADVRAAEVVLGAYRDDLAHAPAAILIWLAVPVPAGRRPQVHPPAVRRGDQVDAAGVHAPLVTAVPVKPVRLATRRGRGGVSSRHSGSPRRDVFALRRCPLRIRLALRISLVTQCSIWCVAAPSGGPSEPGPHPGAQRHDATRKLASISDCHGRVSGSLAGVLRGAGRLPATMKIFARCDEPPCWSLRITM